MIETLLIISLITQGTWAVFSVYTSLKDRTFQKALDHERELYASQLKSFDFAISELLKAKEYWKNLYEKKDDAFKIQDPKEIRSN